MAPRSQVAKARAGSSDSEDEIAHSGETHNFAPNTGRENMPPSRASKNAKAKPTARKASIGGKTAAAKRKPSAKAIRPALKDRTNVQDGNETEDVERFDEDGDEMDVDEPVKPKAKRAKTTSEPAAKAKAGAAAAGAKRKTKQRPVETLQVIPETQPDPEDVEQSIEVAEDAMEISDAPAPKPTQVIASKQRATSVQPLQPRPSARAGSVQPPPFYPQLRERSGSVSGAERERRGGDPELRRKMKELEKKYENVNLKYQNLQEIGQSSAQSNFEKLKRASDQRAKDANELIASLHKELGDLRKSSTSSSSESTKLQTSLSSLANSNDKLTSDNVSLKSQLQLSQNEVKSLDAKLAASRQATSVPGSEMKASMAGRGVLALNATEAQKEAKMKENLYSDLTGLIINRIKRKEGEDEYDCIQTGRNGTLHFHLLVQNDSALANPKTPSGLSYEDAEFGYEPLLDESRDREMLDVLPDYLTEEICFPRIHAQKFYSKLVDSIMKKVVLEEAEE